MMFKPTRAAGQQQLAAFIPRAARDYAAGRNADHGPDARRNVSLLSPYIRHRLVSEEEVVRAVLSRHSPQAAEKFIQEVVWRTYWKGWLEQRPAVWTHYLALRDAPQASGLAKAIATAEAGRAGIEGFDDWAQELVEHGYLHNHARMWFASIWIFTLRLPWAAGADFFLRHLVDADPASNILSWRWVAGLQTQGKTYLATADNISRNTGGRFAPKGLATTATALSEDTPPPAARPLPDMPVYEPRTPALLLITGEDLTPEQTLPNSAAIRAVHAVGGVTGWPWGKAARAFVSGGADDARDRAGNFYNCPTSHAETLDADTLIAAAQAARASIIVTPYAPVGPTADALAAIAPLLSAAGVPLIQLRREWDSAFWPDATKGFFPFKQTIPARLAEMGMRA
ncbi:MAG: FAD-binding domain-containing protein [Parasphingorhabdus sp.]|nr:FAD-binding domain-containing protein [Parasphingorhabdus sp.]